MAGDGTGNYNCDGKDDHIQINQALDYAANHPGTTVYLKGPFVYDIESSCLIGSNTELTGDSSAKLRLADNVGWTTAGDGHPMIGQIGGYGTAVHNITIHGFELDGNEANNDASSSPNDGGGKDPYRCISFEGSSTGSPVNNITVYNMYIHDSKGDGFRVKYGANIFCYNNKIANTQHTCVYYRFVNKGYIKNNTEYCLSCSGDRIENCQNIIIDSETITTFNGSTHYPKDRYGFAYDDNSIQIGDGTTSSVTKSIVVKNCNIKGGVNGIYIGEMSDGCNVNIYNNEIHDSGYENEAVTRNGGIGITHPRNGITIQNNDIIGSYVAGINVNSAISGTHTVTVANNNIMNCKTGYAVNNSVSSQVNLVLAHNYVSGNPSNFYPSSLVNSNPATSLNSKLENETTPVQPVIPIANFSSNVTSGYVPFSIQFKDLSQYATRWNWNFGDGTSSTLQSPTHVYTKIGNYTVNLTAINANGTSSKLAMMTVSLQPILPAANFTSNVTEGYAPLSVQFTDLSENVDSLKWDFGDGNTSMQQSPVHIYAVAGNYTVTLIVKNANGTDSKSRNISVIKKEESYTLLSVNDNRLREASPEDIFSNTPFLDVGGNRGVGRYRDILSFDLNGYTNTTQIKSATLSLFWYYPNSSRINDTIVEIYRPASTWNSSYVSWNKRNKGIAWKNPGGDWYDKNGILQGSTPYATLTLKASSLPSNSYCEFDVTDLVREYIEGKRSNTGVLIKARIESDNYIAFYSTDSVNKNQVPKLKLVYS